MKRPKIDRLALTLLALPLLLSSGCATSDAFREGIAERDARIEALEADKAQLQRERQSLYSQLNGLSDQLQQSNARPEAVAAIAVPASSPVTTDDNGVQYGYRNGMPVITIPSSVSFGSGKAELSKEGEKALREVARRLRTEHRGHVFSIEGHTDTDPIKKSKFATNRDLSLARAMAVLTFLVEECKITDKQCVIVGHGEYEPLEAGKSSASKERNRRVEIVVHGLKS